jgi:CubicO group peptidase (beta-lactamase class C family)
MVGGIPGRQASGLATHMRSAASIALVALLASVPALAANTDAGRIRTFESSLRPAVSVEGESEVRWSLRERMEHRKVPGLSIAVIRGGKLAWARGYGVLQAGGAAKVDTSTVFSVGSVSKVAAAAVTLRLADAGKLDLDRNVNAYLTRWRVPDDAYTTVRPVTLRGLLSHSAGFTINGFKDFQPDEKLPTVLETLAGRAPATHGPVRVIEVPGTRFRYSGGGITVEQLVIEDATGLDFQRAARQYVLEPLGMRRSSFENPLPESFGNIAKAHDGKGQPRALPRGYESMPEMAASGLWTSASDCAQLVIALIESYRGGTGRFLSTGLARQMMTEVGRSPAGLGPFLQGQGADRRFFHGGANLQGMDRRSCGHRERCGDPH